MKHKRTPCAERTRSEPQGRAVLGDDGGGDAKCADSGGEADAKCAAHFSTARSSNKSLGTTSSGGTGPRQVN